MINKEKSQIVTFADVFLGHTDKKWEKHWLKKVSDKVNWKKFGYRFEKLYRKDNGRPGWDPMILFRCLLLAQWYGLSDRDLEEAVEFRIDFRRFVGLRFEEPAPDSTTFSVFRERISVIKDKLLRILNEQLENAGLEIKTVVAVDATLVESHSKPLAGVGGDDEASWRGFPVKQITDTNGNKIFSRRAALHGYKINLSATIGSGFVSNVSVCPAAEHESRHLEELILQGTNEIYADKGYYGCKNILKDYKIKDFIHDKGFKNRPLTNDQIARNKNISKYRGIVEGVFGAWKQWYGWKKTKYMGLSKNILAVTLTAVSWNMKKWALSTA